MADSSEVTFDKPKHIKYWQRCLKSLLPTEYTSTDSSRMMLGFLILAALDLLDVGVDTLPSTEREGYANWLLSCQHPHGGFCGSPNHTFPANYYRENREMDPASLPATFFALINLGFVGELGAVNRMKCLRWLAKLQREDGSFGEFIQDDGKIGGGQDMRYCHFAAGVRWILKGELAAKQKLCSDVDVDGMVRHIRNAQTYDGGFGESSAHESHGGYTYNAISASAFLGRLPSSSGSAGSDDEKLVGIKDLRQTIHWLLSRQVAYDDADEDQDGNLISDTVPPSTQPQVALSLSELTLEDSQSVGCNGRCNKKADTCYCYWVGAALKIIGKQNLINKDATRRFLLAETQHVIGGFGKAPGFPPDAYHSYLGLALLAQMDEPGLKPLDSVLCISQQARDNITRAVRDSEVIIKTYWKGGKLHLTTNQDENYEQKMAEDEGPQYEGSAS